MSEWISAGLVLAVVTGALVLVAPQVIARLPEPDDQPGEPEAKESYADLATVPGLGGWLALASAIVGFAIGARLGLGADLLLWGALVPVCCTLAFVDWRTRYLPTRIIAPTYVVLIGLLLLVSVLPIGDGLDSLRRAAIGWLTFGGLYLLLWLIYPKGLGYGDVRLSGLLGLGLGHIGLAETIVGAYAGFLLGGIGGLLLSKLGVVDRKHYPFGPFMVVGAVVAILAGPQIIDALGY